MWLTLNHLNTNNAACFISGGKPNPKWDRTDHGNVEFMVACFGYHLIFNLMFMVIIYYIMYKMIQRKTKGGYLNKAETQELLQDNELTDVISESETCRICQACPGDF